MKIYRFNPSTSPLLWALVLSLFSLSCSTEKDAWVNRTFHQTTARYNGYFNAGEALKEGLRVLNDNHRDDFTEILPMLKTGDERSAQGIYSYMDEVISKCANVIQYHSMVIRRKEKNKWIDENYFLIGKARFFKQEYPSALEAFDFIVRKYPKTETANLARVWMARTHIKMGNMNTAMNELEFMADQRDFPRKYKEELYAALADAEIIRGNYVDASRWVRKALEAARKKDKKIRYTYILAQLNQKLEEYTIASGLYKKVTRMNPPYEFTFNAKIARARSFDVYSRNSAEIIEELEKMVKDDKNIEYLDQIYYALADVYLREGNTGSAIEHLRLSIKYNLSNSKQLAQSYYTLGELYFEQKRYVSAQLYYDSASTTYAPDHPNFSSAVVKSTSLEDLVTYVQTINREDSLQTLALMSEGDRNRAIDQIIVDVQRKEEEAQAAQNDPFALANQGPTRPNSNAGGQWYFYNPSAMSLGFSDFRRKWGNRKLEDNWRRKNKQSGFQEADTSTAVVAADPNRVTDPKKRDFYLQDIPLDKERMAASELRMEEAYYRLGIIYKEKLEDYRAAIKTFEGLVEKFPGSTYELRAYYYLYTLYDQVGFRKERDNYEAKILGEYPDSELANLIRDPNYFENRQPKDAAARKDYKKAFAYYEGGSLDSALNRCIRAETKYADNPILPKFALLKALVLGRKYGKQTMETELLAVASAHSGTDSGTEAERLAGILGNIDFNAKPVQETNSNLEGDKEAGMDEAQEGNETGEDELTADAGNETQGQEKEETGEEDVQGDTDPNQGEETQPNEEVKPDEAEANSEPVIPEGSPYKVDKDEDYNYLLVLPASEAKVDRIKALYSDFNQEKFSLETLVIRNFLLGQDYQLVTIRGLKDLDMALRYYSAVVNDEKIGGTLDQVSFSHFVISQSNFGTFYARRDISGYQAFFDSALLPLRSGN